MCQYVRMNFLKEKKNREACFDCMLKMDFCLYRVAITIFLHTYATLLLKRKFSIFIRID